MKFLISKFFLLSLKIALKEIVWKKPFFCGGNCANVFLAFLGIDQVLMIMIILSNFQLEFFWASSNLTMNEEELGYNDTTTSINESYYREEYSDTPCNIYLTEVEYNGSGK